MSDNPTDNKILIKFEIHVPVGTGAPPVIVGAPPSAPAFSPPYASAAPAAALPGPTHVPVSFFAISRPGATANVKATSPNTSGVICVTAHESPDFGRLPAEVWCQIVSPGSAISAAPDEFAATQATPDTGSSLENWHIDELPNAECAWSGSGTDLPLNELVIWRNYPQETFWTIEVKSFRGRCAGTTDCPHSFAKASQGAWDTIPAAMQVIAKGFTGKLSPLNGKWLLPREVRAAAGRVAWASGGDGVASPRVQLHGQTCGSSPMSLELSCGGQRVAYTLAYAAFRPLSENRFSWCSEQSRPFDSQFPGELTVTPARSDA